MKKPTELKSINRADTSVKSSGGIGETVYPRAAEQEKKGGLLFAGD